MYNFLKTYFITKMDKGKAILLSFLLTSIFYCTLYILLSMLIEYILKYYEI